MTNDRSSSDPSLTAILSLSQSPYAWVTPKHQAPLERICYFHITDQNTVAAQIGQIAGLWPSDAAADGQLPNGLRTPHGESSVHFFTFCTFFHFLR